MNLPVTVLVLATLALIGSLPLWFFRQRGRSLHLAWWLTASPFWLAGALLVLGFAGVLTPALVSPWLATAAALLAGASALLIGATVGVHRRSPCLWHQEEDTPDELVTTGPYRWVRHPFYSAFLLALGSAACALPHLGTLAALVLGITLLDRTAEREELRLLESSHQEVYRSYWQRTGRFLPRRSA